MGINSRKIAVMLGLVFLASQSKGGELLQNVELPSVAMTYDVLLPSDYDNTKDVYTLVLFLHGGGEGGPLVLRFYQKAIEELSDNNHLPPHAMVFVTPRAGPLSFYLDFQDDSKKWESWIIGPLLTEVRQKFRISAEPKQTCVAGISMGGAGVLQFGFKHPEQSRTISRHRRHRASHSTGTELERSRLDLERSRLDNVLLVHR
jgi:S-formylglutathione hydrolase FrmB